MKKAYQYITGLMLLAGGFTACHKVDVVPNSAYTEDVFPKTEAQFQSIIGPVYTSLRGHFPLTYFFVTECATDAAVLPAYGGNWYDGAGYMNLHKHTWNRDHGWVTTAWNDMTNLIGTSNQTLFVLSQAEEGSVKNTSLAEVKTMRAYAFWEMMDLFGGVPLDTVYPAVGQNARASRAEVFNFVESELKNAIPYLKTEVSTATYGKPTRYFAYALLARMYLNAEVYTGTAKYNEAIAACDTIINSGKYSIQPRASYLQMFYPTNGPTTQSEFIYAIPYDPSTSAGYMFYGRYDLNRNLGMKYRYSGSTVGGWTDPVINQSSGNGLVHSKPSGPRATLSSYLNYFLSDPNDIRLSQWLYGPQYWASGNPIMVSTTKLGYNQFYTGSDGAASYIYPLSIDTAIELRQNTTLFDCGNDEIAWNQGARNIKFLPDANSISRNQNNDVPVFRYSDIILTKAEAIQRGGTPTLGHSALSLVNLLRAQRSTSAAWTSISLDDLYQERSRELSWECVHRTDMIRFGHFEDAYGRLGKTNSETYRRLYPIPATALNTNSKLTQNTGY